jgi:CRP-like cAMP-binding protein
VQLDSSAFVADPEVVQALAQRATPLDCKEDRILFRQGEMPSGLYILQSGEATLSMDSGAGDVVLSFQTTAGSLLGLPGLVGNCPYSLGAVARAGARLSFITRDDFTSIMQANPMLSLKILQILAAEVHSARRAICSV